KAATHASLLPCASSTFATSRERGDSPHPACGSEPLARGDARVRARDDLIPECAVLLPATAETGPRQVGRDPIGEVPGIVATAAVAHAVAAARRTAARGRVAVAGPVLLDHVVAVALVHPLVVGDVHPAKAVVTDVGSTFVAGPTGELDAATRLRVATELAPA